MTSPAAVPTITSLPAVPTIVACFAPQLGTDAALHAGNAKTAAERIAPTHVSGVAISPPIADLAFHPR
jgi:hypothetical protein